MPPIRRSTIEPRNTKGSAENIPLLEAGKIDIGLVQGEAAYEAFAGIGRAPANLKIVSAMYSSPGMFVVRADSPYRTHQGPRGKPVAFGARGSGLVILARYVLDGLGLDQDKDFQAIYLDRAGDGPAMVLDGRAAALWGGGTGWPGFTDHGAGAGRRALHRADGGRDRAHPRQAFVPQGAHDPGRQLSDADQPIASVGSWSFVLARPTLDDEVAYRLARALHRGEERSRTKARAGARDHGRQYRRRGAEPGDDPSRRCEISARDRRAAVSHDCHAQTMTV